MVSGPRLLTIDDYAAICALWEAADLPTRPHGRDTRQAMQHQLSSDVLAIFGCWDDQQLVGAVLASHDSRKGWINRLAVHPDFRHQGIARQLIRACETHFEETGITVIAALVETENVASLALLQDEGYRLHQDIVYLSKRKSDDA
jgi:ribosomal protein S18 acetylase RimI-like enzyme